MIKKKNFSPEEFTKSFILILLLTTQINCTTFSTLLSNTEQNSVLSPLSTSGAQSSELKTSSTATIDSAATIAIKEEEADVPKIDDLFLRNCVNYLKVKNAVNMSDAKIEEIKKNICSKIIVNSGSNLKSFMLSKRMLAIIVNKSDENVFDLTLHESQNLGIAADINTKFIDELRSKKQTCWDNGQDPCGATDQLKEKITGFSNVQTIIEEGIKEIADYIQRLKGDGLPTSLSRRRILPDSKEFILVSEIKIVMDKMNNAIRKFNEYSIANKEAFLEM